MLFKTLLLPLIPLTALAGPLAAESSSQRPCGLKMAPCPGGLECVPRSPVCADTSRCLGICQPVPPPPREYSPCGGFRIEPLYCKEDEVCRDDPRQGPSCGMACDASGICTPKNVPTCGRRGKCPRGLTCYDLKDGGTIGWEKYRNKVCL